MDDEKLAQENIDGKTDQSLNESEPKDMKHLDFITSIVIMGVSVFTAIQAYSYYIKSKKAFYGSPGFMPMIIAVALFLLAVYLMFQSINKSSISECLKRLAAALPGGIKSVRFKNTIIGLSFFAVYVFVLLRFLPFWLSSIILLFGCFIYLKAASIVKSAIIAVLSSVGIVLLFQIVFRVPMP